MLDFDKAMASVMGAMGGESGGGAVPLTEILTSDLVLGLVAAHPEMREALLPLLPDGQRSEADLRDLIRSPQLQQSMRSLTGALQTENLNAVMANTGLDPAHGAAALQEGDGVLAFLMALQARADAEAKAAAEGGGDAAKSDE